MRGVNRVFLLGTVGRDPEVRQTPSGACVAEFSLATSEKYKDNKGQQQEKTTWHNIVAWKGSAEIAKNYVKKGINLFIEGKIDVQSWDGNDGQKKYKTNIIVSSMNMIPSGSRGGGQQQQTQQPQQQSYQQPPQQNQPQAPIVEDSLPF